MTKNPKRPRDTNQLAKLITDIAVGDAENEKPAPVDQKKRKGGLKGAESRAKKLSKKERSDIAKKAAKARWTSNTEE